MDNIYKSCFLGKCQYSASLRISLHRSGGTETKLHFFEKIFIMVMKSAFEAGWRLCDCPFSFKYTLMWTLSHQPTMFRTVNIKRVQFTMYIKKQ
jgi:hypothetical protein